MEALCAGIVNRFKRGDQGVRGEGETMRRIRVRSFPCTVYNYREPLLDGLY